MARIPYLNEMPGFESTSTFATLRRPEYSVASSSTIGATALQGPHHVAQKSTSTGTSAWSTSVSKFWSVAARAVPISILRGGGSLGTRDSHKMGCGQAPHRFAHGVTLSVNSNRVKSARDRRRPAAGASEASRDDMMHDIGKFSVSALFAPARVPFQGPTIHDPRESQRPERTILIGF